MTLLMANMAVGEEIDYFDTTSRNAVVATQTEAIRPNKEKAVIWSLAGGSALFLAVGGVFHFKSNKNASLIEGGSMRVYSEKLESTRQKSIDQSRNSIIAYGIGGGLAAGAIIYAIATRKQAKLETVPVAVDMSQTSVVVSKRWSF